MRSKIALQQLELPEKAQQQQKRRKIVCHLGSENLNKKRARSPAETKCGQHGSWVPTPPPHLFATAHSLPTLGKKS